MASTRIRYLDKKDGTLVSQKRFHHPTEGGQYQVVLNPSELSYTIVEALSETVAYTGKACSLHKIKIASKAKLQELGISFDTEERDIKDKVVAQ